MWRFEVYVPLLILVIQIEGIQSEEPTDTTTSRATEIPPIPAGAGGALVADPSGVAQTNKTNDSMFPKECGHANFRSVSRVNGGNVSKPHDWPWQVLIVCLISKTDISICGGVLITEWYVLTAGHCILNNAYSYHQCTVHLGKHTYVRGPLEQTEQSFKIAFTVVHSQYKKNHTSLGFDIALLKLDKKVIFTHEVSPICMPFGLPDIDNNSICYTTGWGAWNQESITTVLRQIRMPIRKPLYCGFTQEAIGPVICAGEYRRQENVCNGDSGGPLACLEIDGTYTVRGIVSLVDKKCLDVTSYSKVADLQDWIRRIIGVNSKKSNSTG